MKFWPFSTRGARVETEIMLPPIDVANLDFGVFERNDDCIKLWLPEKLIVALDRLSVAHDTSRPDVLRRLLFEHVYGRDAFEALNAWKMHKDEEARIAARMAQRAGESSGAVKFSTRRNTIDMFGKATEDFKLWLPGKLKVDIDTLASHDKLGISDYLRKVLVRILLGEQVFMNWQILLGAVPHEWRQFENDP